MSMLRALALAALPVLALSRCATEPGGSPPASRPLAAGLQPGAALVGLWRVHAPAEGERTWIRIAPGSFTVDRDRRALAGAWLSSGHSLIASIDSGSSSLASTSAPWITGAATFQRHDDGWALLSSAGSALATLVPDSHPLPLRNTVPDAMSAPTVAPSDEALFRAPIPAAQPGRAPTSAQLLGTWVTGTAKAHQTRPSLTFFQDGTYKALDGCNGVGGRWLLLPANRLLVTTGASTSIGCDNRVDIESWLRRARQVSVLGGALSLLDQSGTLIGALTRA